MPRSTSKASQKSSSSSTTKPKHVRSRTHTSSSSSAGAGGSGRNSSASPPPPSPPPARHFSQVATTNINNTTTPTTTSSNISSSGGGGSGGRWLNWQSVSDISMSDVTMNSSIGTTSRSDRRHFTTTNTNNTNNIEDSSYSLPMEYSESEDDHYQQQHQQNQQQQQNAPPANNNNHHHLATGRSQVRLSKISQSSRIVKFTSSSSSLSDDNDDEEEEEEDEEMPKPQPPSRQQQQQSITTASTKPTKSRRQHYGSKNRNPNHHHHHSRHHPVWNAVSTLAHARSPEPRKKVTITPKNDNNNNNKKKKNATTTTAFHTTKSPNNSNNNNESTSEQSPLLALGGGGVIALAPPPPHYQQQQQQPLNPTRAIHIASLFLMDFQNSERPSLPADLSLISTSLLQLRNFKYSTVWQWMLFWSCTLLFFSSVLEFTPAAEEEGEGTTTTISIAYGINVVVILIFAVDIYMGRELRNRQQLYESHDDPVLHLRHSRMEFWTYPMMMLLFLLSLEMMVTINHHHHQVAVGAVGAAPPIVLWSGCMKPIALFYLSNQAKNALEALNRIARLVTRVLIMELLVILSFATVACQVYRPYAEFSNLTISFISLFQLSTTVTNPSIWMPMYHQSWSAAIFFILFITTSVFYLHSLVLSVVFQTYVQASTDIHDRSTTDREDTMRLAFLALERIATPSLYSSSSSSSPNNNNNNEAQVVQMNHVRATLQRLRPHYNEFKINALVEIVDPTNQNFIDYPTFRSKMRQALNASIRSTRTASTFSVIVELIASLVAVTNCIYVFLLTSNFHAQWFDHITFSTGCIITLLGAFELVARFGHAKLFAFTPITRLNSTFDGLAAVAAIVSLVGIFNYYYLSTTNHNDALALLLIGRAIDMIRIMRFAIIFRDIVRRSGDVLPALNGPLALVLTAVHLFTYLGMALWGGAITIGSYGDSIQSLYDLNNFNSYGEGLVTMFQVLVVNDWHAIANVFLYAAKCSSPYIVYPFFIGANLVCVSIMLNCLTAFFVGAFVTKRNEDVDAEAGDVVTSSAPRDFTLAHSGQAVHQLSIRLGKEGKDDEMHDEASAGSDELYEFDVYEREGYDKIMRTVAGAHEDDDDEFARNVCNALEVFELLCPGRERVGYMVCCQQTLNRYGNRRFQSYARPYIHENALHMVVSDMHAELLLFSSQERILIREFRHLQDANKKLEITASLIRQQPAMSLFVSRIVHLPEA